MPLPDELDTVVEGADERLDFRYEQAHYAYRGGEISKAEYQRQRAEALRWWRSTLRSVEAEAREAGHIFRCCRAACNNEAPGLRTLCPTCDDPAVTARKLGIAVPGAR